MMLRACLAGLLLVPAIAAAAPAAQAGAEAPDFVLPAFDGGTLRLSDLRGSFVYVDFWASWCAPCRQSFPWMNRLATLSAGKGLRVIAINVDERRADAEAFLKVTPAAFTVLLDPKGDVAARYRLPGMPTSFLIGPDGRIRWMHAGFRSGDDARLQGMILREMSAR